MLQDCQNAFGDGVGIGLDYDGAGEMRTEGIEDVSRLPNLSRGPAERGYADEAIGKILGGKFHRVFAAVW